jgi:hypothetical protein
MFKIAIALMFLPAMCATSTKLVTRTPDASLMQECANTYKLPPKPTGNDVDKHDVMTTQLLQECIARHHGLVEFEKAGPK